METPILIYAKYDPNNSIMDVRSNIFINNLDGWTQIDEWVSGEDRYLYAHADNGEYVQEKYGKPLYDDKGRPNFHDNFILWSEEEKEELYPIQEPEPSEPQDIEELRAYFNKKLNDLAALTIEGGK